MVGQSCCLMMVEFLLFLLLLALLLLVNGCPSVGARGLLGLGREVGLEPLDQLVAGGLCGWGGGGVGDVGHS